MQVFQKLWKCSHTNGWTNYKSIRWNADEVGSLNLSDVAHEINYYYNYIKINFNSYSYFLCRTMRMWPHSLINITLSSISMCIFFQNAFISSIFSKNIGFWFQYFQSSISRRCACYCVVGGSTKWAGRNKLLNLSACTYTVSSIRADTLYS